jgi:hypothetical protein
VQRPMVEPKLAGMVVDSSMGSWVRPLVDRLVERRRMAWEPRSSMEPGEEEKEECLAPRRYANPKSSKLLLILRISLFFNGIHS